MRNARYAPAPQSIWIVAASGSASPSIASASAREHTPTTTRTDAARASPPSPCAASSAASRRCAPIAHSAARVCASLVCDGESECELPTGLPLASNSGIAPKYGTTATTAPTPAASAAARPSSGGAAHVHSATGSVGATALRFATAPLVMRDASYASAGFAPRCSIIRRARAPAPAADAPSAHAPRQNTPQSVVAWRRTATSIWRAVSDSVQLRALSVSNDVAIFAWFFCCWMCSKPERWSTQKSNGLFGFIGTRGRPWPPSWKRL